MKLLRSRLFRYVFIVVLVVGLFVLQIYAEKMASNTEIMKTIYQVNKNIDSKHEIKSSDLSTVQISQLSLPEGYVTDPEQVVGKYTVLPVTRGSFILTSNVTDNKNFEDTLIPDGYKMISIPLTIDQAAGWKINKDQVVDIVFSPNQYNSGFGAAFISENDGQLTAVQKQLYANRTIYDVEIVDIINEALVSVSSDSFAGVPKYIVIIAKNSDAEFIALAKDKGRFDLLVKND